MDDRNGIIELYEKDGDFYDHDNQDLLVASFYDKECADKVAQLLNGQK
ncbi:hypothetical protein [Paenibacillus dendrobii]|nr:hypothetical protein [Paenibacillus dendrobii]